MIIAVTGSSGFIGKNLVASILDKGYEVIKIDIKEGINILNWNEFKKTKPFDVLIHLAAMSFVPASFKQPRDFYQLNINGVINGLELCRKFGAKFIFTSSYVYGKPKYLPIDEKHPLQGFNPYSETKIIGEKICEDYNKYFNIPVIILRPFNIYGKGQNENFLIPSIIKQAKTGTVKLLDSRPKRDFIYIDDIVEAFIKAVECRDITLDKFNVGSGQNYSVSEIAEYINQLFDNKVDIEFNNSERNFEVLETVADICHISEVLKWYPSINILEGLTRLLH